MRSIVVVGTESPALKMATLGHFNVHRAMVTRFIAIKPILWYVLFVGLTVGNIRNIRNVSKVSGRPRGTEVSQTSGGCDYGRFPHRPIVPVAQNKLSSVPFIASQQLVSTNTHKILTSRECYKFDGRHAKIVT